MPKLTKRYIDTVGPAPDGRDLTLWDDALTGFGLRVRAGGAKTWIVMYRNREGTLRKLSLGRVGTLTPDEARDLAREKLAEATKGADPAKEKTAARTATTVSELCDWYVKACESGERLGRRGQLVKASTLAMDKSRIETHVKPLLGKQTVTSLTMGDIERFQSDVAGGKTAKKRAGHGRGGKATGGAGVAARSVGMLKTILEFGRRRRVISANPAQGVTKYADQRQERRLSLNEIAAFGVAMRAAKTDGENVTGLAAIRALLLTGMRRNEILGMEWGWLDAQNRCVRLPDSKSGAQIRPIGPAAITVIQSVAKKEKCEWVFPADRGDGHFVGAPRVLERVCKRASLEGISLHVLRHSFASVAAEMGFTELTIAGLLGHTVKGVTARYTHLPDSALVAAADRVAARIASALDGHDATLTVLSDHRVKA